MLYAIVAVIALILDQAVKYWTTSNIALNTGTKELIPHIVHLANVHNTGAAFSFLQGARWFFVALCVLFVAIVIYLLAKNIIKSQPARWMAVLVMAGGIGNCIDRIVCGYVVDMFELSFKIFGRSFPVFNVADIFITVCGILFCIFFLLEPTEEKEKKSAEKTVKAAGPSSSPARAESAPVKAAAPVRSAAPSRKHRKIEIPDFPKHPRVEQPEIDPNDPFAEWERIVNKDSGSAAPVEASEAAEPAAPVEPAAPAVPVEVAAPAEPAETAEPAEVAAPAVPDAFFASIHSDDSSDFSSYIAAELAAIRAEASEKKSEPAAEAEAPQETVVFSPAAEPADEANAEDDEAVDDVFSFFGRQKKDKAPKEARPVKKDVFAELKAKAEKTRSEKPKAEKEAAPAKAEASKAPKAAPRHAKADGKSAQSAEAVREELSSAAESFDVESFGEESYRLEDILEEFKDL